jgi:histidyl-tRNA synthetase
MTDVIIVDTTGSDAATALADLLRGEGLAVERAFDGRSMRSQMKLADRSGARVALVIGPQELAAGQITMRELRSEDFEQAQVSVAREDLTAALLALLNK